MLCMSPATQLLSNKGQKYVWREISEGLINSEKTFRALGKGWIMDWGLSLFPMCSWLKTYNWSSILNKYSWCKNKTKMLVSLFLPCNQNYSFSCSIWKRSYLRSVLQGMSCVHVKLGALRYLVIPFTFSKHICFGHPISVSWGLQCFLRLSSLPSRTMLYDYLLK